MKNGSTQNVSKHREIKNNEQYVVLNISLKFGHLEKTKITYSDPKDYLVRSGKGLTTFLSLKYIRRSKNVKKEKFSITEVSLKYISSIFEDFKDVPYEGYVSKRSKHMPTDSYFYLTR